MARKKNYGNHAPSTCGGAFACEYNDKNIPYLKCEKCGHLVEDWIKWESTYKDLWKDDSAWKEPKNHVMCILGYFCFMYEKAYSVPFPMSYTGSGLFKGTEVTFIRRLLGQFSSSAEEVKSYITWFFEYKVDRQKKKIVSLSPLVVPAVIGLYRHHAAASKEITRSTKLPDGMIGWIKESAPEILQLSQLVDFGDLQKVLLYASKNPGKITGMDLLIQELYKRKWIDNNLNIQGLR